MKKLLISLICVTVIAVLAIVACVAANGKYGAIVNPSSDSSEEGVADPSIKGYEEAEIQHEVVEMTVTNPDGTLHFTPKSDEDSTYSNRWYIKELNNQLSHDRNVQAIASAFFVNIPAKKIIQVTDSQLSKYGLDNPEAVVTIELKDGSKYKYSFGSATGLSGDLKGYYMMCNDKDVVYIVESYYYERANYTLVDVVSSTVVQTFDTSAVMTSIHIWGTEISEEVKMAYDAEKSTYHVTEPADAYLGITEAETLVLSMDNLSSDYIVAAYTDKIPDDMYAFLGFADPPRKAISVDYYWDAPVEGQTDSAGNAVTERKTANLTLLVGATVDDADYGEITYLIREGTPIIYAVAPSSIEAWGNFVLEDYVSLLIYTKDMYTVDTISYVTDFKTFTYDVSATTQLDSVTLNGEKISTDVFKKIYSATMALQYSERTKEEQATKTPFMTIIVKDIYGNTDQITFTKQNERRYYVTVNGKGGRLISYQMVDDLFTMLKDSDKGVLQ